MVASTRLNESLSLLTLAQTLESCTYDPETFSGLVYRRSNPKGTVILFATGKVVSVGTRSEREARSAIYQTLLEVKCVMPTAQLEDEVKIENVVAVGDVGHPIDLSALQLIHPSSMYEPEKFPGIVLKTSNGATILAFANGKVVCTGTKREIDAKAEIEGLTRALLGSQSTS